MTRIASGVFTIGNSLINDEAGGIRVPGLLVWPDKVKQPASVRTIAVQMQYAAGRLFPTAGIVPPARGESRMTASVVSPDSAAWTNCPMLGV